MLLNLGRIAEKQIDIFGNSFVACSSSVLIFVIMSLKWSLGRRFVPTWNITFVTAGS